MELLFDVVLVFAFNRLAVRLAGQLDWHGFYSALVLLMALWWLWYRMAWTANRYDPARPMIQVMIIVTMLGALLMAAALPAAFEERAVVFAVVFAGVFVAVDVLRHLWLVLFGGKGHEQLVSARIVFWACLAAVPWIAGIYTDEDARLVWWSVARLRRVQPGLLVAADRDSTARAPGPADPRAAAVAGGTQRRRGAGRHHHRQRDLLAAVSEGDGSAARRTAR